MSKLDELLKELCPNGVEYKTLGELGEFYGGITGKSKSDFVDGNAKFITYMNVYKNLKLNLDVPERVKISENENQRTLEYGDVIFTGSSETPDECGISSVLANKTDEKLYLNSFCICYRFNDKDLFNPEFTKYLFRSDTLRKQIVKTASGVTRFNVSKEKMRKVAIPVPPLPVQEEIVRILDTFTSLTAELTAELTARRKQYEYYRDSLLTRDRPKTQWKELQEIAEIGTGSCNTNEAEENGEYPFYVRSPEVLRKNSFDYDETAIITAGDGVGVGKVFHYVEGKYALHQRAYRIHITDKNVIPRYYYHYMKATFLNYILKEQFKASVQSIRRPMLNKYPVPIPSLKVQEKIVNVLDNFDSICMDLKIGLPAEIEARKKQYEYYRDLLLTFANSGNTILSEQNRTEQMK